MSNEEKTVDSQGLVCPIPLLYLRRALISVSVGDRVRLLATDKKSLKDVPLFCKQMNHKLIETKKSTNSWEFVVEKSTG